MLLMIREQKGRYRPANESEVLNAAQSVLAGRLQGCDALTSPSSVREYLKVKLGGLEHEIFALVHLNAKNCVIEYQELFRGTVSQCSVHPREVVKECLARNSAALILVHNHPSGVANPSQSDETLTQTLKTTLALVDVRVLDHLIIAGNTIVSFAERGIL